MYKFIRQRKSLKPGIGVVLNNFFSSGQQLHNTDQIIPQNFMGQADPQRTEPLKYDVAIIGGGSAGLGFALAGLKLGLSMVIFDYIEPSPRGSTWGLGGTCLNVGCIPKKLMHQSSLMGESTLASKAFGWHFGFNEDANDHSEMIKHFKWDTLRENVQNHIKAQNFGYKTTLVKNHTRYINALAAFKDGETIIYSTDKDILQKAVENGDSSKCGQIKFQYAVVCTGGRPTALKAVEQFGITSDDVFSLKKPPGKTLVIGGGYIALECAGFLAGLGYPVTLMTRGLYLRDFDQDVADMIVNNIQKFSHVNVVPTSLPFSSEKLANEKIKVQWKNTVNQEIGGDEFDTVLMAVGRTANTSRLNLESVGVKLNPKNSKIICKVENELEKTHGDRIFALGDVLNGVPELTPVASKSAQLLARRINYLLGRVQYSQQDYEDTKLDYNDFPTTVFTPLEYSCVGLNEEQARQKFGDDGIEIYHSLYVPLEEELSEKIDKDYQAQQKKAYCKVVCDKKNDMKVVGLHYLGPNAGEVMQGYAVAIKLGLKFKDLQRAIGIHPTCAEEFVVLKTTKASGEDYEKHGC